MPDDFETNFKAGLTYFQNKQYDDAITKFKDALVFDPKSSEVYYFLGLSYHEKEMFKEAINEFNKAITLNPHDPEIHNSLAISYLKDSNDEDSIKELAIVYHLDSRNVLFRRFPPEILFGGKSLDFGIKCFRKLVQKNPNNIKYRLVFFKLLDEKGLLEESLIQAKELVILEPFQSQHHQRIGSSYRKMGRLDEALYSFKQAIKSFPDDDSLKESLQEVLLEKIVELCEKKKWDDSINIYQTIIAEEKLIKYSDSYYGSALTNSLTNILKENNRENDGINLFLRLFRSYPEIIQLSSALRDFLKNQNIKEEIIDDYIFSIQNGKNRAEIHYNLAEGLDWPNKLEDIAIEEYRRAIELEPDFAPAHFNLGVLLIRQKCGKEDEAIKEFREVINLLPDWGNVRYWLARELLKKDQYEEAIFLIYDAIGLEPDEFNNFYDEILSYFITKELFKKGEEFFKRTIDIFDDLAHSRENLKEVFALNFSYSYNGLAEIYRSRGLLDEAITNYRQAIRLFPLNAYFHWNLADIYFSKNLLNEAISEYKESIKYGIKKAFVHKKLADALMKNGQFLDAQQEYREAMKLEPDNEKYVESFTNLIALVNKVYFEKTLESITNKQISVSETQHQTSDYTFQKIISEGENESIEFKSSSLWSKFLSEAEISASYSKDVRKFGKDTSKIIIAKTITGFLNANGGNLVIGIKENKVRGSYEIIGIESEFPKLKDPGTDGYRRMIMDEIIKKYFPSEIFHHLTKYIKIKFPKNNDITLCCLTIKKSDMPVFLRIQNEDYFFIRIDAETRQLAGRAATDYCLEHFKERKSRF
jgi:tetratricopeptide (TPR) repeat protein